ncbi:MAG: hypothetical protein O7A04_00210, partial [Acidobacteria bacterium]|nr:hypothetical protein [Acidobacteriota bacterium]
MTLLEPQLDALARLHAQEVVGTVAAVKRLALYVHDLPLGIGSLVRLQKGGSSRHLQSVTRGEVIGFDGPCSIVMLFGSNDGV